MTPNTTPEKPEWFELTDGDAPSAQVTKVNKKLPVIAVLITGAVIATGAFFANASEEKGGDDQRIESVDFANPGAPAPADSGTQQFQTPPKGPAPHSDKVGVPVPPPVGQNGDHEEGDDDEHGDRPDGERHERGERGEHGERNGSAPKIPTATSSPAAKA